MHAIGHASGCSHLYKTATRGNATITGSVACQLTAYLFLQPGLCQLCLQRINALVVVFGTNVGSE
jgi:hypothetical protein